MKTILVIEDMSDTVELVQKALTAHGYRVLHAADAETGFRLALEHHPDLILLDLGLPDYDGQTLAAWLKTEPSLKAIPILVFTAWPQETARQMVQSYSCNGYIPKPILRVKDFIEQIQKALRQLSP
ncbi:MAG: response regulator [Anaerolineales bacterium]|nr:response regulator [Anaerolineales bacterium]MCX7609200.1 response regulator [Anaerolineales bacterium]